MIKNYLKQLNLKRLCRWAIAGIVFAAVATAFAAAPDPTKDLLTSAKTDITTNFGPGSTLAYIIYLIEVISGVAAYIKTKNLFALVGVIVVVLFTTAAFAMIGT
jgi:type IV conjugative transfer system pilin TraA